MLESEYRIDVIEALAELIDRLHILETALLVEDAHLPAWLQPPPMLNLPPTLPVREQVCALLKQLSYLDGQAPREILVGPGLLAASKTTICAIERLNASKDNFKAAMLNLKHSKIAWREAAIVEYLTNTDRKRPEQVTNTLQRLGLSRIHLKQSYRKIPVFSQRPTTVSWTWANTRSIKKITALDAEQLLLNHRPDQGIAMQLNKVRNLPPDEELAIIQNLAPHLRANIVMRNGKDTQRFMVKGPVPIFYLDSQQPLPTIKPPGNKKGRDQDRLVRKDVKIDSSPFLPAIRAHRYLKNTETAS